MVNHAEEHLSIIHETGEVEVMKQVLISYKDRLVNISGRNRSLILRKIYKKRSFDLVRAYQEQDLSLKEFFSTVIDEEKKASLVIKDPYKTRMEQTKITNKRLTLERENEITALTNAIKKQESLSLEDESVIRNRKKDIDEKYKLLESSEVKRLELQYETLLQLSNQLNYLYRETLAIEKETGKYELYVGYPFVEGRYKDGSFVRAPFFLFPVEIEIKSNQWYIKNSVTRDPMVNKVFLFAAAKCHQATIKTYDELDVSSLGETSLLEFVESELNLMGMTVSRSKNGFQTFSTYTNATLPIYKYGELHLIENAVIGQFPISNSIYDDYERLEDEQELNGRLVQLMSNRPGSVIHGEASFSDIDLPRKELFTIAPIDFSQETAIKALTKTEQLVIYGPPGTGKSQTISNMISDALSKGKRILMVSQKRAALDVLFNRLSLVQSKMMLIHDANKDKKAFFERLKGQIENGFDFIDSKSRITFEANANEIDRLLVELKTIETELSLDRPFGISLLEMYMKSDGIFNADDIRYPLYKTFRDNNPFKNLGYNELTTAFEHLNKQPLIVDTYFKYANLFIQFPYLSFILRKLTFLEKETLVNQIPIVLKNAELLSMEHKSIQTQIAQHITLMNRCIDDMQLTRIGKAYNSNKNAHLVETQEVKWWNVPKLISHALKSGERKANQAKFEMEEKNTIAQFLACGHKMNNLVDSLSPLIEVLSDEGKARLLSEAKEGNKLFLSLESFKASMQNLDYFYELSLSIKAINSLEISLLDYSFKHSSDKAQMGQMLENLFEFIILEHISDCEKTEGFNTFYLYFNRFRQTTESINKLSLENEKLTGDIIKSVWNDKMQLFLSNADFKELKRQAEKKRQLWPIRNMLFEFTQLLFTIYPCWMMSPETVSDILPLQADLFDLIIFDEASQMFVESAIPTIYRGKKVVISGDDKQLRPTSTFMARVDEEEEEAFDIETAAALEEESLLDLAKVNYDQVHLNYHYRSSYEELIQFSNYAFYNGRLNVAPNRIKYHYDGTSAIERIKIEGRWINRKNSEEANRVVELVDYLLKNRNDNETIGIITFNITQKDLIEDLLDARCQIDETFKSLYEAERVRKKKDEDISIFVKNIENVQGDERDIIIFSVGYAKNEQDKVSINFGSLSQDGGENRLNVAISRAKKKTYVITSIEPEELYVAKTKNNGAKLFRQYLQYAKEVSEKAKERQSFLLNQLTEAKVTNETALDEFVEELSTELRKAGYIIENNVGSGKYKLDIAIWDEKHNAYILGIECDSMIYPNGQTLLERDIYRQRFYKARGWDVLRIWCYDWWKNSQDVLAHISEHVNSQYDTDIEIKREPLQSTEYHLVEQGENESCWYGDRIQLKDLKSNEVFTIQIDATQDTKNQLNEFKQMLIDRRMNDSIVYRDYEYRIVSIMKLK
jgi:very-short-patch-repair endonuclease